MYKTVDEEPLGKSRELKHIWRTRQPHIKIYIYIPKQETLKLQSIIWKPIFQPKSYWFNNDQLLNDISLWQTYFIKSKKDKNEHIRPQLKMYAPFMRSKSTDYYSGEFPQWLDRNNITKSKVFFKEGHYNLEKLKWIKVRRIMWKISFHFWFAPCSLKSYYTVSPRKEISYFLAFFVYPFHRKYSAH